jgi:hypothetical protein
MPVPCKALISYNVANVAKGPERNLSEISRKILENISKNKLGPEKL